MVRSLISLLAVLCACERTPEPSGVMLAALGQAKAYHHLADLHLEDGKPDEAIRSLQAILRIPFPAGAADGEDALLDARARLGKTLLGLGRMDEAAQVVAEGLGAGDERDSFFLANLYTVSGELHEARAHQPGADAAAERHAAIAAYGKSIEINERIQKRLMEERP